jgi:hypothetical protein
VVWAVVEEQQLLVVVQPLRVNLILAEEVAAATAAPAQQVGPES